MPISAAMNASAPADVEQADSALSPGSALT
jgi:hypothetical protein